MLVYQCSQSTKGMPAALPAIPYSVPAVATCLVNVSHRWKSCVPCPFSPEVTQAELHQTWWMKTCTYEGLIWTCLVWKDSQKWNPKWPWNPNLRVWQQCFQKVKTKKQSTFSSSFKGYNGLPGREDLCMHGDRSLPGWSSLLRVTPGRASRGRELVRRSWWREKKKLKRDECQINVIWHSCHPQPLSDCHWLQELLLWGQTEASVQGEVTWHGALFVLPSALFQERKQKIKQTAKRESFTREEVKRITSKHSHSGRYRKFEIWEVRDEMWGIIYTWIPQKP